jgi:hypothetical protein
VKLANPLYYPLAILAGGIVLVIGARLTQLPSIVVIPVAAAIATGGAITLKAREPESLNLENPELERDVLVLHQQARALAIKAEDLRREATQILTSSAHLELLGTVQYACDRAVEMPQRLETLTHRLQGSDSLLSVEALQQQLVLVRQKQTDGSGVALDHFQKLAASLQRNIDLARQGSDARQAQVISLSTLVQDAAGSLQALQNKLRTSDLSDTTQTSELQELSQSFKSFQEDMQLLTAR